MIRKLNDKPSSPRSTASSADSHTVQSIYVASSMTTTMLCQCGNVIPWAQTVEGSTADKETMNICLERIRIEKERLVAAYDLVRTPREDDERFNRQYSWGRYATAPTNERDTTEAVRQLILHGQLCLECALNYGNVLPQDKKLMSSCERDQTKLGSSSEKGEVVADDAPSSVFGTFLPKEQREELRSPVELLQSECDKEGGVKDDDSLLTLEGIFREEPENNTLDDEHENEEKRLLTLEFIINQKTEDSLSNDEREDERGTHSFFCTTDVTTHIEIPNNERVSLASDLKLADSMSLDWIINDETEPHEDTLDDGHGKEAYFEALFTNAVSEKGTHHSKGVPLLETELPLVDAVAMECKVKDEKTEAGTAVGHRSGVWRCNSFEKKLQENPFSDQEKITGLLLALSEKVSSAEVSKEFLMESSLLLSGADLNSTVKHTPNLNEKLFGSTTSTSLSYGIQNINATTAQYVQGFPFVKSGQEMPNIFSVTLCPPHDLESFSPEAVETISFDLGFTVSKSSEGRSCAVVAEVVKNSPAAIVGIRSSDRIKFAVAHTLSSPFRKPFPKLGSVSLLTYDSSFDSLPAIAVYHGSEVEAVEAADYALARICKGAETTFEEFRSFFPFDVATPLSAHRPAVFEDNEDPILFPVTVVFERSKIDGDFLMQSDSFDNVKEQPDEGIWKIFSCLGNSQCVL